MRLNQLIAEKVMGWRVYSTNNAGLVLMDEAMARDWGPTGVVLATQAELDAKKYIMTTYVPEYSTSIEAAWEVVEKMKANGHAVLITTSPFGTAVSVVAIGDGNIRDRVLGACKGGEEPAPLAICLAALRAVGTPEQEITAAMEAK